MNWENLPTIEATKGHSHGCKGMQIFDVGARLRVDWG